MASELEQAVEFFFKTIYKGDWRRRLAALPRTPDIKILSKTAVDGHHELWKLKQLEPTLRPKSEKFYLWARDNWDGQNDADRSTPPVYTSMMKAMGIDEERALTAFRKYEGADIQFREGTDDNADAGGRRLVVGRATLLWQGEHPWFWLYAPGLKETSQPFTHRGPVIMLPDLMYLVGIGCEHLRQWTIQRFEDPLTTMMPGIVLGSLAVREDGDERMPCAAKTVLVHEALYNERAADMESLLDDVQRLLDSGSPRPNELRGWEEHKPPRRHWRGTEE